MQTLYKIVGKVTYTLPIGSGINVEDYQASKFLLNIIFVALLLKTLKSPSLVLIVGIQAASSWRKV